MGYLWLSKSAASTALDASEILLLLFGLILTIGALGEYKKFPRLLRASHATFELLVVIGIAGELFADGGVFIFSRHIQSIDDKEVSLLSDRLTDSQILLAVAEKDVSNTNKQIAELNLRAKAAEAQALEAKLALERFKAPRTISEVKFTRLIKKLKPWSGQLFGVAAYKEDKECADFATRILHLLLFAGWTEPEPRAGGPLLFVTVTAVEFSVRPTANEKTRDAALSAASILNAEDIRAKFVVLQGSSDADFGTMGPNTVLVRVGKKP